MRTSRLGNQHLAIVLTLLTTCSWRIASDPTTVPSMHAKYDTL